MSRSANEWAVDDQEGVVRQEGRDEPRPDSGPVSVVPSLRVGGLATLTLLIIALALVFLSPEGCPGRGDRRTVVPADGDRTQRPLVVHGAVTSTQSQPPPSPGPTPTHWRSRQTPPAGPPRPPPPLSEETARPEVVVGGGSQLNAGSSPAARLFIDGALVGETPKRGLSLRPGRRVLLFKSVTGEVLTKTIQVGPGELWSCGADFTREDLRCRSKKD